MDDDSKLELAQWAKVNASRIADRVLVTFDDATLGAMDGGALVAMAGTLMLPVSVEQLAAMKKQVQVLDLGETFVGSAEQEADCLRIARGDTEILQRCRELAATDFRKEKAAIDRAEAELDSPKPDCEAALRDLGVDTGDSGADESRGRPETSH